jgi:hypothetical protein
MSCVPAQLESSWTATPTGPVGRALVLPINPLFKRFFNRPRGTLADCTECGADYVHPVEWSPHDGDCWWMLLRCGACGASREETVPDAEAELYERELDRAELKMRRAADRLSQERLVEQTESFATALELDLIGAEDFARPQGGA